MCVRHNPSHESLSLCHSPLSSFILELSCYFRLLSTVARSLGDFRSQLEFGRNDWRPESERVAATNRQLVLSGDDRIPLEIPLEIGLCLGVIYTAKHTPDSDAKRHWRPLSRLSDPGARFKRVEPLFSASIDHRDTFGLMLCFPNTRLNSIPLHVAASMRRSRLGLAEILDANEWACHTTQHTATI